MKLLQAFVGAALLFVGVFATVAGFGFLFDHSATVPYHGRLTNNFWVKAINPAIGVVLTVIGALLWLGYPHRRPREAGKKSPPAPGT